MSEPRHTIEPHALLEDAWAQMRQHNIRHLLVMDGERLVGVVADRDLRRVPTDAPPKSLADHYLIGKKMRVANVMSKKIITADGSDDVAKAAWSMLDNRIDCLPVLQNDTLEGILTSADLLKALTNAIDPEGSWRHGTEVEG